MHKHRNRTAHRISTPSLLAATLAACLMASCAKEADPAVAMPAADTAPPAAVPATPVVAAQTATPAMRFDRNSVPVSLADMGPFPYLTLPQNYSSDRRTNTTMQLARFPFWVDGGPQWVEGKFQLTDFTIVDGSPTTFSQFEVKRHIESQLKQWGGVKVSEARIPREAIESWGSEITEGFSGGIGDIYNEPATTYFIRRNDGDVWIHLVVNTSQGWTVIGKQETPAATGSLP